VYILIAQLGALDKSQISVETSLNMAETTSPNGAPKKHIILNAFDMSTVGHLSPGQWKVS
jgi:hypothetical protein